MISVEVALERVLSGLKPTSAEMVALPSALGRVLATPLAARVSHPSLDVSSMDGYAVRASDLSHGPTSLELSGESAAGHPFAGALSPGRTIRIFTGAAIPEGADAVVMQEDVTRDGQMIGFHKPVPAGNFIRRAGMDFAPGQILLDAGTMMGPRQIGLASAMNVPWVDVRRRPRVAVLSTGDEIVMPGDPLHPGQLVSANGPALTALVTALGCETHQLGIARDSRQSLSAMIAAAQGCDLLVTSGGASVGDYDLVQDALAENGISLDFWKIALRPGKPLMFGTLKHVPVLGLPGNPVSAMVCAYVFLVPMIRAMQGLPPHNEILAATLDAPIPANDERQSYLRADMVTAGDGTRVVTPHIRQDSAVISGLANSNALIIRAPHAPSAQAGETVQVMPLAHGF